MPIGDHQATDDVDIQALALMNLNPSPKSSSLNCEQVPLLGHAFQAVRSAIDERDP
jgi:hypothetical protein